MLGIMQSTSHAFSDSRITALSARINEFLHGKHWAQCRPTALENLKRKEERKKLLFRQYYFPYFKGEDTKVVER